MRTRSLLVSLCAFVSAASVMADARAEPTLSGSIEEMRAWVDEHRVDTACTYNCSLLEQLTIVSDNEKRVARFTLTGQVLEPGSQNIPLFGDVTALRIRDARLNGGPATIGFEDNHWYLRTAEKHFTLTGTLSYDETRKLTVAGPLNAIDVEVKHGSLGSTFDDDRTHFTGVQGIDLYFNTPESEAVLEEAGEAGPRFDLMRAIRVGERNTFEYHLTMSDSHELGTQKIPLRFGEEVASVEGARSWEVADGEAILHFDGVTAQAVLRGNLPDKLRSVSVDARSTQGEWLLVESDLEHEVKVTGDVTYTNVTKSPIARTSPFGRLMRLTPSQAPVALVASRRTGHDVLGAIVQSHERKAVLTASGNIFLNDVFVYENRTLDWLPMQVRGRALYLAVDGVAQPMIFHDDRPNEVTAPTPIGRHSLQMQSRQDQPIRWLGGRLAIPMPEHALPEGSADTYLALPAGMHPVVALGGERSEWFFGHLTDALALGASLGLALLAFTRKRSRAACAVSAFGVWWLAPGIFVAGSTFAIGAMAFRWVRKNTRKTRMGRAMVLAAGLMALAGPALYLGQAAIHALPEKKPLTEGDLLMQENGDRKPNIVAFEPTNGGYTNDATEHPFAVESPMPEMPHAIHFRKDVITRDKPFVPTVYYVTDAFLWLTFGGWLAGVFSLAWMHREGLARLRGRLRMALAAEAPLLDLAIPREPYRTAASCAPVAANPENLETLASAESAACGCRAR